MSEAVLETATAKLRRRTDLHAVLNPRGLITYAHLDRAVFLALEYGWNVASFVGEHGNWIPASSCQRTRTIYTTPIRGDAELALFAHEGGHIEDQEANHRRHSAPREGEIYLVSIEAEITAWQWAMKQLGWRWNKPMQDFMTTCVRSYGIYVETADERRAVDALITDGHEKARQIIRLRPYAEVSRDWWAR